MNNRFQSKSDSYLFSYRDIVLYLVFHEKNRHNGKSITILVRCNRADERG